MALTRWKQPVDDCFFDVLATDRKSICQFWYFHNRPRRPTLSDLRIQHSPCAKSLVKPKSIRVQPWFNQTGFYGCQTRLTRLYICVKSLVNQAISGKLSKPGIILKKTKQWLYRGSWSFESTGLTRPLTLSVVQVGFCVPWLIVRKQLWSTILKMRFGGSVRVWLSISFLPRSPQPKARNSYLF